jgi:hypothetical protein
MPKAKIPKDAVWVETVVDPDEPAGPSIRVKVPTDYERVIQRFAPLTDDEKIEQALRFANTTNRTLKNREAWWLLRFGVDLPANVLKKLCQSPEPSERPHSEIGDVTSSIDRQHKWLREYLVLIANKRVRSAQRREWERHQKGLGYLRFQNGSVNYQVVQQEFDVGPSPQIAYALLRLDYLGALCQCHWSECGKFFLATRTGRRGRSKTRYCPGTDHDERAFRAGTAERMARMRARRKHK